MTAMSAVTALRERPLVGLLYTPASPAVLDAAAGRVDYIEVIPDRFWYDFGSEERDRFAHTEEAIATARRYAEDCAVIGHGIGLSLASDMPIDEALLDQVVAAHRVFGFRRYSEHLSMFLVPGGSIPNAQAGLGLPVVHDLEALDIVAEKVTLLQQALGVPIALENGTIFSAIPDPEMSEPEFLNRLHARTGCGMLLDLHNLYANTVNLGWDAGDYLGQIDPEIVFEIHIAGGDWLGPHYTDSHSRRSPPEVMAWLADWAPRFPKLDAITFEYHESYHKRIGTDGVLAEIEAMHAVADEIAAARMLVPA